VNADDWSDVIIGPGLVPGVSTAAVLSVAETCEWHDRIAMVVERIGISPASRRGARWEPERVSIEWREGVAIDTS
jgi:hypothetical protein